MCFVRFMKDSEGGPNRNNRANGFSTCADRALRPF